jgi:Leucine-rich repeat (LRR) protein
VFWSNLELSFHKTLFALTTNKSAVNKRRKKTCCDPLWLRGGPIPLDNKAATHRNVIFKTAGKALEEAVTETIETLLLGLMVYQIYDLVKTHKWSWHFEFIVNFYKGSDTTSYFGMIKALHDHPALFAFVGVPLGFAVAKTIWSVFQVSDPSKETVRKMIVNLKRSDKWDSGVFSVFSAIPTLSSLLFFHPQKRNIPGLATLILWEGELPREARESAFNKIIDLVDNQTGLTQMTAIRSLAHLAHGLNLRDLDLGPKDVEGLLKIKVRAFHKLKEVYENPATSSYNKTQTGLLLWEIGQSQSWTASILGPLWKAIGLGFYGYTLYGILKVAYDFVSCKGMYLNNFTWLGGTTNYSSDYSQSCFDAYLSIFNKVPGQPSLTLVSLMDKFKLNSNYTIFNLSGAGASGKQVAELIMGLRQYQPAIHLTQFDLRNNSINTASGMTALMAAFKNITQSAPPGKGITLLNLLGNGIGLNDSMATIVLGKGLQNLPFLEVLNLSGNGIGCTDSNGIVAIGEGLRSLTQLQTLDLSRNQIGEVEATHLFAVLPQLICNGLEKVNLEENNFKNISWSQAASALQGLYAAHIYGSCASKLCSGAPIHVNLTAVKCHGLNDSNSNVHDVLILHPSIQNSRSLQILDSRLRGNDKWESENDEGKREASLLMKKDGESISPLTSSASPLVPFYQPLVNSVKPWFSWESWSAWGDRALDSVANSILSYSHQVVENAPGYYPGRLDSSKSLIENSNKEFYNYPQPHFRALDQSEPLPMLALPQPQGWNYTFTPAMLSGGNQPLMLFK